MTKIAVFASGSGSNTENIINYFTGNESVEFPLIISNNKDAYVHERAKKLKIPSYSFKKASFENDDVLSLLKQNNIDFIILAGFLLKIPENILQAYPNKIVNIHPALLPKFGGKGMYGMNVHNEVVKSGEKETGITIHYVNENYDEGHIIFQTKCEVLQSDTPEDVARKVHELEYKYFPEIISEIISIPNKKDN